MASSRSFIILAIVSVVIVAGIAVTYVAREDVVDSFVSSQDDVTEAVGAVASDPRVVDVEMFTYGYAPDPLVLTAGETVLLRFASRDVAHSFSMFDEGFMELNVYVPEGETIEKTFTVPDTPGDFYTACNVFCGSGHSTMTGIVRVIP